MNQRRMARALARLAIPGAIIGVDRGGPNYGVFSKRDRRQRALLRLSADEVKRLQSDGAIAADGDVFVLSAAGTARAAREGAEPGEAFVAQHNVVVTRDVVAADGALRRVRGFDPDGPMRRLAALRGPDGGLWLNAVELAAATKLRADWAVGEIGLVRGSDWSAAPMGSTRGAGNAQEAAMARRCDARRRVGDALGRLAAPMRRVVERVCLYEEGLTALERAEGWPARSGKLALKLGLAQLAAWL